MAREFATTWPEFDLDPKTRAMLSYASKLTEAPGMVGVDEVESLKAAGWDERGVWEITALASFFNFTGRMEAASGLPPDDIPHRARFAEGRSDTS